MALATVSHMPGSETRRCQERCSCGAEISVHRWALIQAEERPDLVAQLARGDLLAPKCDRCGRLLEARPLDVLLRTRRGRLLLTLSADGGPGQLSAAGVDLLHDNEPGPVILNLPFDAAPVVLARSIESDLEHRAGALAQVRAQFGDGTAATYDGFLSIVEQGLDQADVGALLDELGTITNAEGFAQLVKRRPELLGPAVHALIGQLRTPELAGGRRSLDLIEQLLLDARDDPIAAWRAYQRGIEETEALTPSLADAMTAFDDLAAEERWDEIVERARVAIEEAHAGGIIAIEGPLRAQLAVALLRASGDRAANLEEAIEQFEAARFLLPSGAPRGQALINLAVAYGSRIHGDPLENFEAGIQALEDALGQLDERQDPEPAATAHTNLARSYRSRERGDAAANLAQARFHAEAALRLRSPDVDADVWAFSESNLADVLDAQAQIGADDPAAGIAAFEAVLAEEHRIKSATVVGNAHLAIAAILRRQASVHEEEGRDRERLAHLARAREHVDDALDRIAAHRDPVLRGRALTEAANVRAQLGDVDSAHRLLEEALPLLLPTASPRDGLQAAWHLASLYAEAGRWEDAVRAYGLALEAAQLTFHARHYTQGREAELRGTRNLARFASYAMARAGRLEEALLVLDDGRARELRRRAGAPDADLQLLEATAPELHAAYVSALQAVTGDPLGEDAEDSSRALATTVAQIRQLRGLAHFGRGARLEDIGRALEPGWPLIYVNAAPAGTAILSAMLDDQGDVQIGAQLLDGPNALEVFLTLSAGDFQSLMAGGSSPPSYMLTASGVGAAEVADALDYVLPWLGERLAAPVAAHAEALGATGITLLPCGPLALAPLHAADWSDGGGRTCLLDRFDVRYAPSALVHAACLARTQARAITNDRVVALGNPTGDLPAAEAEAQEIAGLVDDAAVALGPAADSAFLRRELAAAAVLHLACHGESDVLDLANSVLHLADGPVALRELTALGQVSARLATVSACQTALTDVHDLPDEMFSIGTAFIAAGSACAIASLWSVDDAATALLMVRMHEELRAESGLRPPEALRRAALWLRDVTPDEEARFLAGHPALERELRRRRNAGDDPGRGDVGPTRYAHPDLWAAFIAVGA
jgi:CHAT domain-containing protein/tetratricopeptide (TPR) repeat protein